MQDILADSDLTPISERVLVRLKDRQRAIAGLFRSNQLSTAEYGALTIDNVYRMFGVALCRGKRIHAAVLGINAAHCFTRTVVSRRDERVPDRSGEYGDYGEAVHWVCDYLHSRDPNHPEVATSDPWERTLVWGPDCEALLRKGKRRCAAAWRLLFRAEAWLTEVHEAIPFLSRWAYAVLGFVAGTVVTWWLKR